MKFFRGTIFAIARRKHEQKTLFSQRANFLLGWASFFVSRPKGWISDSTRDGLIVRRTTVNQRLREVAMERMN